MHPWTLIGSWNGRNALANWYPKHMDFEHWIINWKSACDEREKMHGDFKIVANVMWCGDAPHHKLNDPLVHTIKCVCFCLLTPKFHQILLWFTKEFVLLISYEMIGHWKETPWIIDPANQKLKRIEKPRQCVNVCNVGKRFVVDGIFRWNYSISAQYICSKELFHLLPVRDVNQTENSRPKPWKYCVRTSISASKACTMKKKSKKQIPNPFYLCVLFEQIHFDFSTSLWLR